MNPNPCHDPQLLVAFAIFFWIFGFVIGRATSRPTPARDRRGDGE
jgi:hypothetical protein